MRTSTLLYSVLSVVPLFVLSACGGSSNEPAKSPDKAGGGAPQPGENVQKPPPPTPQTCGEKDKVHVHDIHDEDGSEAFVPCSATGHNDYSGVIKIETLPEGIHIVINATDDEVKTGALGSDVKNRDAVIVYPRGRDHKSVEVPLMHTTHGYAGDKIVPWEDLDKLNDEGTKIHVAIYDHDAKSGTHEELSVQIAVSTGKSCEKAMDENPQTIDMGKKNSKPDLTKEQLGAPMKSSAFFQSCGLPDSANADVCVAVKQGKPLGVSVKVAPSNNKVAACIDKAARRLAFPQSDKLDVVKQHF
jgi:hypothetical protein